MISQKNFLKVMFISGCYLAFHACASSGFDEDSINQRRVYRDDDTRGLLPTPEQAAEEARQYRVEEDRKQEQRKSGDDAIAGGETESSLNDLTAAYAQILVPQAQEEQPYFAPTKKNNSNKQIEAAMKGTLKAGSTLRRRPVFLGKIGVEAMLNQMAGGGVNVSAPAAVTGGMMSFAARSGRGAGPIANREGMGTYIVRPGDSLSMVSMHIYGTSQRWMELAHLNRLGNGSVIFPNEVILYVPDKAAKAP